MVVRHAGDLHERVHDRWAYAAETPSDQIFAYRVRFRCLDRNLAGIPECAQYRSVVHKAPAVLIK